MRSPFNDAYAILFSDFLYKSICCGYAFELPRLVEAIQMRIHNICFYKEVDKSTLVVILTLKMPRKPASENVICLCRLLNILANFSNLFLHTGKQCGPRSDCS